jgi:hypothetical protein
MAGAGCVGVDRLCAADGRPAGMRSPTIHLHAAEGDRTRAHYVKTAVEQ